jgi:hypothetical protein
MVSRSGPYERRYEATSLALRHKIFTRRRLRAWRQWSVTVVAISSDILIALLVWLGAYMLYGMLGEGSLSTLATVALWYPSWRCG